MGEEIIFQKAAQVFGLSASGSGWQPLTQGVVTLTITSIPAQGAFRCIASDATGSVPINAYICPESKAEVSGNPSDGFYNFELNRSQGLVYGVRVNPDDGPEFVRCVQNSVGKLGGGGSSAGSANPVAARAPTSKASNEKAQAPEPNIPPKDVPSTVSPQLAIDFAAMKSDLTELRKNLLDSFKRDLSAAKQEIMAALKK